MDDSAAPAAFWLFAVLGGPLVLAVAVGWGLWRAHGRANRGGDNGPHRLTIQLAMLGAATIMIVAIIGWWIGYFG